MSYGDNFYERASFELRKSANEALERVRPIIERFSFRHCPIGFTFGVYADSMTRLRLRVSMTVTNVDTGEPGMVAFEVPRYAEEVSTEEEVKHWVIEAVKKAWEHELKEYFLFDGVKFLDPHKEDRHGEADRARNEAKPAERP